MGLFSLSSCLLSLVETCLERKLLQTNGQARKGLISGTGLRDDGEAGGRTGVVARGNLDAGDGGGFV